MSKRGRQRNRVADASRQMRQLTLAAEMVGEVFGVRALCWDAAALFLGAAEEMGLSGRMQPVHTLAFHPDQPTRPIIATSSRAIAIAKQLDVVAPDAEPEFGPGFGGDKWAGHVVTIVDSPLSLWDCNFRQFTRAGYPEAGVGFGLASAEGPWTVTLAQDGAHLIYEPGPGMDGREQEMRELIAEGVVGSRVIARFATTGRKANERELRSAISRAVAASK